jgi:hypothetical protein
MITKEEVVKILSGNHFLKSWEVLADEILALDKKEEFPKYGKVIKKSSESSTINIGDLLEIESKCKYNFYQCKNIGDFHSSCVELISKEDYDKQQQQPKQPVLDYEILAYKVPGNEHWEVTKIGNGTWNNWSQEHVDEQVKKGIWKIKRVKRLYDGQVFTIGDKVKRYSYYDVDIIRGFSSHENGWMFASISDVVDNLYHDCKGVNITAIEHVKSLLITEDGVEVALGDSIFYVFNDETPMGNGGFNQKWKPISIKASSGNTGNNYYKLFSTQEAALKYIETKKPVYKTHNGEDVLLNDIVYVVNTEFKIIPMVRITKAVSIATGYEIFKTHREAYQYVKFNKPCLSLEDILASTDMVMPEPQFHLLSQIIESRI